jgi:fibronectin type 3 domain-containing protein
MLIIEWKDVKGYWDTPSTATFEVIFMENSKNIMFQYLDVDFGDPYYNNGNGATVGIQLNSYWGTQFSYNSPSLTNNTAILWTPTYGLYFDMGTLTSPIEEGYTSVTPTTIYSPSLGFGWDSSSGLDSRDRGAPDDLRRDFVFSAVQRTFKINTGNGLWLIQLGIGDKSYAHDRIDILIEGFLIFDNVNTTANQFVRLDAMVYVTDGTLDITLRDDGGSDPNWILNYVEIYNGLQLDAGTQTSPCKEGFNRLTPSTTYGTTPYGWDSSSGLDSRDRGAPDDLRRDFVFGSAARTLRISLPNGKYYVYLIIGDISFSQGTMNIASEGITVIQNLTTPKGVFRHIALATIVSDGELDITFSRTGGASPYWLINGIIVISIP